MLFIALMGAFGARAEVPRGPTPLTAVECGWKSLSDPQRTYLIYGGDTDRSNSSITIVLSPLPPNLDSAALAQTCSVPSGAVDAFATGLLWRAKEEGARLAIARVGRDPAVVDKALPYLFAPRRRQMGDALSCPGGVRIDRSWDRDVADAISRTRDRSMVRSAYSFAALALFARAGQEGAEQRIQGEAAVCAT